MREYLFKTKAITRCYECPFRDGLYCLASDEKPINKYRGVKTRESFCPLVEVPSHGRLIDVDALPIKDEWSLVGTDVVWDAPTVLEATEGRKK